MLFTKKSTEILLDYQNTIWCKYTLTLNYNDGTQPISYNGEYIEFSNGSVSIYGSEGGSGYGFSKAKLPKFSYPLNGIKIRMSNEYRKYNL